MSFAQKLNTDLLEKHILGATDGIVLVLYKWTHSFIHSFIHSCLRTKKKYELVQLLFDYKDASARWTRRHSWVYISAKWIFTDAPFSKKFEEDSPWKHARKIWSL